MTYIDIIKKIEGYRKRTNSAFQVLHEHGSSPWKKRDYTLSLNKYQAALSAVLDIYYLFENGYNAYDIQNKKDQEKSYIEVFKESLDNEIERLKKDGFEKNKEKIEDVCNYEEIYLSIFNDILKLDENGLAVINSYAIKNIKEEDKEIVRKFVKRIKENYEVFKPVKRARNLFVFQSVGMTQYEAISFAIQNSKTPITKEEMIYRLTIGGIKDALNTDGTKSIKDSFSKLIFPTDESLYADKEAYELVGEAFGRYEKTFRSVYSLSDGYKNKIRRRLRDYLK